MITYALQQILQMVVMCALAGLATVHLVRLMKGSYDQDVNQLSDWWNGMWNNHD